MRSRFRLTFTRTSGLRWHRIGEGLRYRPHVLRGNRPTPIAQGDMATLA